MMRIPALTLALASAALLGACGGGAQDLPGSMAMPEASHEVPASATVSPTSYEQHAASLTTSENQAPLDVNAVKPPTSETEAPQAL